MNWAEWAGVDVGQFKLVKAWLDAINGREAVKRGLDVPEPFEMKKKMQTKVGPFFPIFLSYHFRHWAKKFFEEGEEEYQKMHSQWVKKGQNADQEKHR